MCTRNRTKDGEDTREETIGLDEIDKEATEAMAKTMDPEDRNTLDIVRPGSAWNRVAAYWSGQVEDKTCQLCLEGEEDANHFWKCKALENARREADKDIAELNPDDLPNPIK